MDHLLTKVLPEDHEILDHLLAEVMVYPVDLFLTEETREML